MCEGDGDGDVRAIAGGGGESEFAAQALDAFAHIAEAIAFAAGLEMVGIEAAAIIFNDDLEA